MALLLLSICPPLAVSLRDLSSRLGCLMLTLASAGTWCCLCLLLLGYLGISHLIGIYMGCTDAHLFRVISLEITFYIPHTCQCVKSLHNSSKGAVFLIQVSTEMEHAHLFRVISLGITFYILHTCQHVKSLNNSSKGAVLIQISTKMEHEKERRLVDVGPRAGHAEHSTANVWVRGLELIFERLAPSAYHAWLQIVNLNKKRESIGILLQVFCFVLF